jgi:phosphohistidine phosphatase
MNLILWRHAEAEDTAPTDLSRQLTVRGRKQAQAVAKWLRARLEDDAVILASPAVRTIQTVESLTDQYRVVRELAPGARSVTSRPTCSPKATQAGRSKRRGYGG